MADFLGDGNWDPDESYILRNNKIIDAVPGWREEVSHLKEMNEVEGLQCSVREMKPSPELQAYLERLGVNTIGDLVNVPVDRVYEHRLIAAEQNNEIYVKFSELGVYMKHEEDLFNVCEVFSILSDGKIVGGYLERNGCVLHIEIPYLAEMIAPDFKQFKIEIAGFGGYEFEHLKASKKEKVIEEVGSKSFEEMVRSDLIISGAQVDIGKVIISCINTLDENNHTGGSFYFYGSAAKIFDEEGREWSIEKLGKLADDYWEGA